MSPYVYCSGHIIVCVHHPSEKLAAEEKLILRTAFSRDQTQKVYVQDLIKEDGELLWTLMEVGITHAVPVTS